MFEDVTKPNVLIVLLSLTTQQGICRLSEQVSTNCKFKSNKCYFVKYCLHHN